MQAINIKNRFTGTILFEYEKENATIKDAVMEAVKNRANLGGADLGGAYLGDAYLGGADLGGAYLRGANLGDAYLGGAYLGGAYLRGAYLGDADLRGANLGGAYLGDAYLGGANLGGADLGGAYLGDAYLRGANLRGAYLGDAYLGGAYLRGAKNIPYFPFYCPSDGAFIGWKKVGRYLIKLQIPEDAKRCSATGKKCRCDKAMVLDITCISDKNALNLTEIINTAYTPSITYRVGEMVYPDSFDENRWDECSHGIHFFINKQDAINY